MAKMDDARLLAFIEQQESRAQRPETAAAQAKAMDYYLGKPFGDEEEGLSSVISSDVWDVVEGLTPLVLKPFVSSDDVVRFNPQGAEDEESAAQETDYINYVVTQKNDVFEQLLAWVKAGLMQKNGVVKYWWDETRRVQIETFRGITDDQRAMLLQDENVTEIEHSEEKTKSVDPQTGQPIEEVTHDVKVRIERKEGQARYELIPPEELRVSTDTRSPNPKKAPFIQHITRKTLSALREMGYEVPDDVSDGGDRTDSDVQAAARLQNGETQGRDGSGDPSTREVWFKESYALVDFDGDGIAEARKVCQVGSTLLANDEVEEWPFAGWTPYLQLHQFDGRCPADETCEIQEVKSTLWRQSLNNIYTINNNRTFISNKVNVDDMIDNQIAGLVRVDGEVVGNHAMSMPITPIGGVVQPMIEYLDSAKENRTGFTRYNQGTDANSLNKTATGVRIIAEAGNERVGLISRAFAEQGLKALMIGIHGLCRRHATKAETVRLRGKWVEIDPREWETRYDMTVSVGLGTSDKTMQLQGHQMLMAEQKELSQVPGLVGPENFFNAAAKLSEILGEKNPGKYFSDPAQQQQPQIPPQAQQAMQAAQQELQQLHEENQQLKSGIAKAQVDAQAKQQLEQMKQQGAEMERQFQAFMQHMKDAAATDRQERSDAAAYDRQELAGVVTLLSKQVAPPPALAADVDEDVSESDGQA